MIGKWLIFLSEFIAAPCVAEVYNLGGSNGNSISKIEAFAFIEPTSDKHMNQVYSDKVGEGDHIVYFSDRRIMQSHYPNWQITKDIKITSLKIHQSWYQRDGLSK